MHVDRRETYFNGLFKTAEVYLPGVFTTNGHPQNTHKPVLLQYLQHSTHSPQKDMIWDVQKKKATFRGNPKLASLHIPQDPDSKYTARIASWRGEGTALQQLHVNKCTECTECTVAHTCSGHCYSSPQNKFLDVGNRYLELAYKTCRRDAFGEDKTTCDGSNCLEVEELLPGSYIWFGVATQKHYDVEYMFGEESEQSDEEMGEQSDEETVDEQSDEETVDEQSDEEIAVPMDEDVFLQKWDQRSQYGNQSFVCDLQKLLLAYESQIAKGRQVVLRCGGTLLYQEEICYVTIVTFNNDECHDDLPYVNSPAATKYHSALCDWSRLLGRRGHYKYAGYPVFTPCSDDDLMVFALHLPDGMPLYLHGKELTGGKPLQTDHDWCHRFKQFRGQAAAECKKHERSYQQWLRQQVSP